MRIYLKRKEMVYIVLLLAGSGLWLYVNHLFNAAYKKDDHVFKSSALKGKIVRLGSAKRDIVKLDNSNVEYRFNSEMSWFNHYNTFSNVADIGDSVNKDAFADTIYLKKKNTGQIIKFTFY
ncbi:MAG: hypothetical protein J0H07_09710 [Sphingobacteriales bacterium]|nr:hypothetical protein [Sphingobacteriales bacterium]